MAHAGGASGTVRSLAQLQALANDHVTCYSGPMMVWIVNYDAVNQLPYKFTYPACTAITEEGRLCRRSVRKYPCSHDPEGTMVDDTFRFEVIVTDGSEGGKPFNAVIFANVAEKLLGISASDFTSLSEDKQIQCVERRVKTWSQYEATFKVNNGSVYLQSLGKQTTPRLCLRTGQPNPGVEASGLPSPQGSSSKKKVKEAKAAIPAADPDVARKVKKITSILQSLQFGTAAPPSDDDEDE